MQVCPEDISEPVDPVDATYPDGWYVRIMFDELLDTSIETLTEILDEDGEGTGTFEGSIRGANPVTLECQSVVDNTFVRVDYDGYYSPSGNRVTWPVGPSLVIKPNDPTLVATGKECRVSLHESIVDKSGNPVPEAQRGPYTFRIAPIQVIAIDPVDDPDAEDPIDALQIYYENVYAQFNTPPDPSSVCDDGTGMDECEFEFTPAIGACSTSGMACVVAMNGADCPDTGDTCIAGGDYAYAYEAGGTEWGFGPYLPLQTGTADMPKQYTFSFKQNSQIKDRCGAVTVFGAPSVADNTLVHFGIEEFKPRGLNLVTNEVGSPLKKLRLQLNNVVDFTSLALDEWTLTPALFVPPTATVCVDNNDCPGAVSLSTFGFTGGGECRMFPAPINEKRCVNLYGTSLYNDGDVLLRGHYALDTEYTFTLRAGATVRDFWGAEYTNPSDLTVTWKTQPAITLGTISPANNAEIGKASPTSTTSITLPFNQSMDPTTFVQDEDFTITPSVPADIAVGVGASPSDTSAVTDCSATGQACRLRITGTFAAGTYTFTLKQGAMISDVLGNVYTHPANTVINFTVEETPSNPAQCL